MQGFREVAFVSALSISDDRNDDACAGGSLISRAKRGLNRYANLIPTPNDINITSRRHSPPRRDAQSPNFHFRTARPDSQSHQAKVVAKLRHGNLPCAAQYQDVPMSRPTVSKAQSMFASHHLSRRRSVANSNSILSHLRSYLCEQQTGSPHCRRRRRGEHNLRTSRTHRTLTANLCA